MKLLFYHLMFNEAISIFETNFDLSKKFELQVSHD